jgi:hypothetical protein
MSKRGAIKSSIWNNKSTRETIQPFCETIGLWLGFDIEKLKGLISKMEE